MPDFWADDEDYRENERVQAVARQRREQEKAQRRIDKQIRKEAKKAGKKNK